MAEERLVIERVWGWNYGALQERWYARHDRLCDGWKSCGYFTSRGSFLGLIRWLRIEWLDRKSTE